MKPTTGIPPTPVTALLRFEGAAIAVASVVAFALTGGNWWMFLLALAPDLSFVGMMLGSRRGAMVYNLAHTYTWPVILIGAGALTPVNSLLWLGLVWATHIGVDRAVGYGMKYPEFVEATHLGLVGRSRKDANNANAA